MAKILGKHVPCLVSKETAAGTRYYWQPSATLKRAGWKPVTLPMDLALAIAEAEAQNEKIAAWKGGGARPNEVKKIVRKATMDELLDSYRREILAREAETRKPVNQRNPTIGEPLSSNTARNYRTGLNIIERWSTGLGIHTITHERVLKLRDALMTPGEDGVVAHHRAHNTLRVLRQLFAHGMRQKLCAANPAEDFELGTPAPRDAVWDEDGGRADIDAFTAAAHAIGYPGLALAVEIAEYVGQRHADILKLTSANWRPVILHDPVLMEALRGDDEQLMGIYVRQGKTKKWVGVPIVRPLRTKIEAAIAANKAQDPPQLSILLDDRTGQPWATRQFHRKYAEARDWAIAPPELAQARGVRPHPKLADLEFRDFRRTCVVRALEKNLEPGLIASITGHSLKTIEAMMEIYGPRTTRQAAVAVLAMHGRSAKAEDEQQEKRA